MSTHPELVSEQAYIDNAYDRLEQLRVRARSSMQDVLDLGRGGTFQARTERDVVVRSALARLEQLDIGPAPLVFGRIDEVQGERYYIGRMGVSGEDQEPLVVDWRAPVAEPFYRATGRFPMGLARRRHFEFQGRALTGIEDEPLILEGAPEELPVAGQGALLAALERSRSGRMNDIVATIQGEQDEVIRSPLPGVLVVQGGPGTGKTAVALHRAAYLLYTHRFPLERQGVLVVGPNPVFLRYIGHVLPSLGESGVTLSTISGLVHDATVRGEEPREVVAIKGDTRMIKFIARAVRSRQRSLNKDVEIAFGSYTLTLTAEESKTIVNAARRRGGTHNARRKRVERMLTEILYEKYQGSVERLRSIDSSARASEFSVFGDSLLALPVVIELLDRMWPRLYAVELLHDLFGAQPLIDLASKGILNADEAKLLFRQRSQSIEEIKWTEADMALIDEARILLGPARPLKEDEQFLATFGHVVVDEAQDLSPMQLRMLGRRSLGGSITIVGDLAQATGIWAPNTWSEVLKYLPSQWVSREVELTIGYRTPAEVMTNAADVLNATGLGFTPPRPVRSSGENVEVIHAEEADLVGQIADIVRKEVVTVGEGTVGVIVPQSLLTSVSKAFVSSQLSFAGGDSTELDAKVTLLSSQLAKGLEFDSVVVGEPQGVVEEGSLRSLYVAVTRTTRRLVMVHARELPTCWSACSTDA